jgi:hypothetical protein
MGERGEGGQCVVYGRPPGQHRRQMGGQGPGLATALAHRALPAAAAEFKHQGGFRAFRWSKSGGGWHGW